LKRWFFVFVLLLLIFLMIDRQRVYVRDPLGGVTFNGVKDEGAQVFINYSNDVLLENDNPPMYVTLVQHMRPVGLPSGLHCIHYLVCLTDADKATLAGGGDVGARMETMSERTVTYRTADGREAVVTLR